MLCQHRLLLRVILTSLAAVTLGASLISVRATSQNSNPLCDSQNTTGNVIQIPGACTPSSSSSSPSQPRPSRSPSKAAPTKPTGSSQRLVTGSKAAQCQALLVATKLQVPAATQTRKASVNSVSQIKNQADFVTLIKQLTDAGDQAVKRLENLSFQDAQLQKFKPLIIQTLSTYIQQFRQLQTANLSEEQMAQQLGAIVIAGLTQAQTWEKQLNQYCGWK